MRTSSRYSREGFLKKSSGGLPRKILGRTSRRLSWRTSWKNPREDFLKESSRGLPGGTHRGLPVNPRENFLEVSSRELHGGILGNTSWINLWEDYLEKSSGGLPGWIRGTISWRNRRTFWRSSRRNHRSTFWNNSRRSSSYQKNHWRRLQDPEVKCWKKNLTNIYGGNSRRNFMRNPWTNLSRNPGKILGWVFYTYFCNIVEKQL